jgi:histone-lysine N-methyltransferase SUV420H
MSSQVTGLSSSSSTTTNNNINNNNNNRNKSNNETMSASQLCEFDDFATMMVIDSYLGFQTHKMNTRFRPARKHMENWRAAVIKFATETKNYEECFNDLTVNNDWFEQHFGNKPKSYIDLFRSHLYKFLHFFNPDSGITIKECTRYSCEKRGGKIIGKKFEYFLFIFM